MIKIQDLNDGYSMQYELGNGQFYVTDLSGTKVVNASTANEVTDKFNKYLKSLTSKNVPLNAISSDMLTFKITSFVDDTNEVWATITDHSANERYHTVGERGKHRLIDFDRKPQFFKDTEANRNVVANYKTILAERNVLDKKLRALTTQLECPITKETFTSEVK
jgi:hypothetical protein